MQGTQYATKRSILCRGAFCGPTVHNITIAAALWTSFLYRVHIGAQTPFIAHVSSLKTLTELDKRGRT